MRICLVLTSRNLIVSGRGNSLAPPGIVDPVTAFPAAIDGTVNLELSIFHPTDSSEDLTIDFPIRSGSLVTLKGFNSRCPLRLADGDFFFDPDQIISDCAFIPPPRLFGEAFKIIKADGTDLINEGDQVWFKSFSSRRRQWYWITVQPGRSNVIGLNRPGPGADGTFTINRPPALVSVRVNDPLEIPHSRDRTLTGGGTITLNGRALPGHAINLAVSSSVPTIAEFVVVPASVTVPAGTQSASFDITLKRHSGQLPACGITAFVTAANPASATPNEASRSDLVAVNALQPDLILLQPNAAVANARPDRTATCALVLNLDTVAHAERTRLSDVRISSDDVTVLSQERDYLTRDEPRLTFDFRIEDGPPRCADLKVSYRQRQVRPGGTKRSTVSLALQLTYHIGKRAPKKRAKVQNSRQLKRL